MRGINYQQASNLVQTAINTARKLNLPPVSVVVLDNGGHVKASASDDGVGTLRFEIARGKANAAIGMRMNTLQFSQLVKQGFLSEAFSNALVGAANGNFNPNPGGILIIENQEAIGAIGISGASAMEDHQVAQLALDQLLN